MIAKYRGISIAENYHFGEWIYGNLIIDGNRAYIVNGVVECTDEYIAIEKWCEVDITTVGQSTGLFDKNGKEIFESDIVIAWSQGVKGTFEIKRRIDGLWLLYPAWKDGQFWHLSPTEDGRETCEVIGDMYRNPELLEVSHD